MVCGKCQRKLDDDGYCQCGKCLLKFHFVCSTLKRSTWLGYNDAKRKAWKCLKCREEESGTNNHSNDNEQGLSELNRKMDLLLNKYEETVTEVSQLKFIILELKEDIVKKDEVICELRNKINIMDQYQRNKNLEIDNIVEKKGENLKEVIKTVADKLNIEIDFKDLDIVHRLPARKDRISTIICQFSNRAVRDEFLKNKRKVITSKELVGEGTGRIYISPNLNKFFKNLRWSAKKEAEKFGYKFVWFNNNKILVRKDESSRDIIRISSEADIQKISVHAASHTNNED